MTAEEVKELLKIYNDIPQMIAEEFATIRNCENEKNKIALPSVNLSGLLGGKGISGDRTANTVLVDPTRYYEEEVNSCYHRIAELREQKNWMSVAINQLDQTDRYILELAFIGDQKKRLHAYRRPPWKEITGKVDYSESQTRAKATASLFELEDLSTQLVFQGMMR